MDKCEAAESWFRRASIDLDTAGFLSENMQPVPIEIVCYLCEQAVEKYLKGFLVLNDTVPQKTHNLNSLGVACTEFSKSYEDVADMLSVLTEYAVHIRYPSEIEISNEDMRRALANAKSIEALTLSLAEASR
jgi:HEPN domain-containing protein